MIASRLFFSFVTLGAIAVSASPAPTIAKRADVSNILSVVSTLKNTTDSILPHIDSLVSSNAATPLAVTPLVTELTSALGTAASSLSGLQGTIDTGSGGSATDVANAVAPIVSDIATTISSLQTAAPSLGGLITSLGLDASLSQVLTGLETLLAGVLNLLATLLTDVAGLLRSLAFGLTLASLGL